MQKLMIELMTLGSTAGSILSLITLVCDTVSNALDISKERNLT